MNTTEAAQSLYRSSSGRVRASFSRNAEEASAFYAQLLEFVLDVSPPTKNTTVRLLDVGCGCGWSTFMFAKHGYTAVGIDLNASAFEPPETPGCTLQEGSATDIQFESATFDVVVTYQCLEHVPAPARALGEMIRVCKPGGVVVVVGPNLVSPTPGLFYMLRPSTWKSLQMSRLPSTPRHPYGNTVAEVIGVSLLRGSQLIGKLIRRRANFLMRSPDLVPPFHADNDACYLCTPLDIIKSFKANRLQIERKGRPGRLPLSYLFAGGTWVAGRKPM